MRRFETLLLISPELPADAREATLENIKSIIEREKGVIKEVDVWGMRDLAYPVQKQQRGFYVRLEYDALPSSITEFERNVRITDGVLKFITVKLADDVEGGL